MRSLLKGGEFSNLEQSEVLKTKRLGQTHWRHRTGMAIFGTIENLAPVLFELSPKVFCSNFIQLKRK